MTRIGPELVHSRRQAFGRSCDYFSLDPTFVESTLQNKLPGAWSKVFGDGHRGGRAASALAIHLARIRCAEGDHGEEARLGLAAAKEVITDEAAAYRDAWVAGLSGLGHQCDAAQGPAKVRLAKELHRLATAAVRDLDARFAIPGRRKPSEDGQLDCIVTFLLRSEQTLGISLGLLTVDLERRERNREIRKRAGKTNSFPQRHYRGIQELKAAERLEWFRRKYEQKTGNPAPDDFTLASPHAPLGWQIRDQYRRCFEPSDYREFSRDMEAQYRQRKDLPAKGEGWLAQAHLASCVKEVLSGYEVIREAKAPWLGAQRLDMYIPALKLAIEYQGQQHYFPLEVWGGEQGLLDRKVLDQAKREACINAGVKLIEWSYKEPISPDIVRSKLKEYEPFPVNVG